MKTKKLLATVLLLAFTTIALVACGTSGSVEDLVGSWVYTTSSGDTLTYIFSEDGGFTVESRLATMAGNYEVDGNTITYTVSTPTGGSKTEKITFKLKGDSVEFTRKNGSTDTFKKK